MQAYLICTVWVNSASHLGVPYVPVGQDPEQGSLRLKTSTVLVGQTLQVPVTDEPLQSMCRSRRELWLLRHNGRIVFNFIALVVRVDWTRHICFALHASGRAASASRDAAGAASVV